MFYSQVILARKGPLGKIWLAAHFDKKLTKNQIFTTDISESVDSVLNPAAPLALRVSGHLMLGIVRIYSRKVKYLMADCTEAMWKIKLAFRAGNVDLADTQSATLAIDDLRYFGNIVPDQDYPELEDIAFSQNMLSNFVSLQAARGRTIASQQDTTQDDSDFRDYRSTVNESPMLRKRQSTPSSNRSVALLEMGYIPGEDVRGDASVHSRFSEIEMMRGETRPERGISGIDRASLSTLRTSMSSGGGLAMRFDDDIPAFDEQIDDFGNEEAPPMSYYNMEENLAELNENPYNPGDSIPGDVLENMGIDNVEVDVNLPDEEEKNGGSPTEVVRKVPKSRAKKVPLNKAKRLRVTVDESVELSSRAIKQRMSDMQPILRRKPGDYLPRPTQPQTAVTVRGAAPVPPGARGLCPELQSLFAMTMTSSSSGLSFPLKKGEVVRSSSVGAHGGVGASRESISIDAVRDNSYENDQSVRRASSLLLGDGDMEGGSAEKKDREGDGAYSPQLSVQNFGEEPFEQNNFNDYEEPFQDNLDPYNAAEDEQGGAVHAMQYDAEDDRPGAGALKSKEEDLLRERGRANENTASGISGPKSHLASEFSARTAMVRDVLKDQLQSSEAVSFSSISKGISRRTAAACFLEVLQLKTWGYIDCTQNAPFADINITATDKLWQLSSGAPSPIQT